MTRHLVNLQTFWITDIWIIGCDFSQYVLVINFLLFPLIINVYSELIFQNDLFTDFHPLRVCCSMVWSCFIVTLQKGGILG